MSNHKYLVYNTKSEADSDEFKIREKIFNILSNRGYSVLGSGIIGKKLGFNANKSQLTESWDISQDRGDGKYVVRHPEGFIDFTEQDIPIILEGITATVEHVNETWFNDQ